jgi:hypothetical protein
MQEFQNNTPQKAASEMTVGAWLITMLILIIPIANIIMLFIWGFGKPDARRNYARASLIWMAICFILFTIFYGAIFAIIYGISNSY